MKWSERAKRASLRGVGLACVLALAGGCSKKKQETTEADAAPANNPVVEELLGLRDAGLDAGVDAGPEDAGPPRDPFTGPQGDSRCRLLWGPARVPFNGPGALRARAGRLEMIVH